MLARLLDVEEGRPDVQREVDTSAMQALAVTIIGRAAPRHPSPQVAANDLFAIMRGMVDAAVERGERDLDDLERRVRAAVFGTWRAPASPENASTRGETILAHAPHHQARAFPSISARREREFRM